jgi:hypothetical protein
MKIPAAAFTADVLLALSFALQLGSTHSPEDHQKHE